MPGMTFKSMSVALLGLLFMAVMQQLLGVFAAGGGAFYGTEAIPLNALVAFALLLLPAGGLYLATRRRLLLPTETLCVLYVLLLAAPLLTTGFWRYMLAGSESIVKEGNWEYYDSLSPVLWPHGADLMAGRAENSRDPGTATLGSVHWETLAVGPGQRHPMPVLENSAADATSALRFRFPLMDGGTVKLPVNAPYMLTLRARAQGLGGQSRYYVRLFYDDHPTYDLELFSSFDQKAVTYLQPEGFGRRGLYGFTVPDSVRNQVTVEVGLLGAGRLEVADLNFFNVSTLQGAYTGFRSVSAEDYAQVPAAQRTNLIVRPASLWSAEGLRFLASSYVPWSEWRGPVFFWGGYIVLLLAATFAASCLLRRQWVEYERLPLPMTQVPVTLANLERQLREGASYLRNNFLWIGFGVMFFYEACGSLRTVLPFLPDLSVSIALQSYLPDPSWGKTWETSFTLSGLSFALALFMDLNILFSLIVGFFLFRFQYWLGESQGLTVDEAYPYAPEQHTGALVSYGLLTLYVARRFLWGTLREAWRGEKTGEVLSARACYGLLLAAFAGIGLLTRWAGLGVGGPLVLTACVLLGLLVAMKLRAESGYPNNGFFVNSDNGQTLLFMFTVCGSLSLFNVPTALFWAFFTMMFFNSSTFPLVPGLQVELVALGTRLQVRRRDVVLASALGIAGGIVVGGWVYLSGAYAVGATNYPIVGQYMSLGGTTFINAAIDQQQTAAAATKKAALGGWLEAHHLAFLFGAAVTTALSFVRQLYAGFWFHPFGFILGPSAMMQNAWGSILAAWAVRLGVLRLGGAATVRERLFPFAVGCVLAVAAVSGLVSLVHAYSYFFNPGAPAQAYSF